MSKYEKYKLNSISNTNTSINFIMDSLNKTEFELIKEMNQKSKEKKNKNVEKNKEDLQTEFKSKKPHNKIDSFILTSKKKYSKYNKVPHQSNKLTNIKIDINTRMLHPERGSDINCYNYYNSNTYKSIASDTGDSKSIKTLKNPHSYKKSIKNYENKYTINKFLKNSIYNNSSYKKNNQLKPKIKIQINGQILNSFKKVPNKNIIKNKEISIDEIIENHFLLNNNNNESNYNYNYYDNTHLLYIIDDEHDNIYQNINNPKKFSDKNDYDLIINNKDNKNIDIISFELLKLNERQWFEELDEISNILIEKRGNFNDNIYNKYIHKMIKIHEHFNWIVNSLGRYLNSIIFENNSNNQFLNYNNLDLPRFENIWFKGFKWKGLFIRMVPQDKSKFIINEIKALNYFFLDYLQIIDKYKNFESNKKTLSNYILFPLISYSEVNGFILYSSCLIDFGRNIENEQSLSIYLDELIKENNGYLRFYSNINNLSYYISINKNKNYNKIKSSTNTSSKLFLNLMKKNYDIKDLSFSKLFSNLNIFHFIKFQKEKFLIFNVAEFIPKLFEMKINSNIGINFFYVINNIRKYYSIKYDIKSKKYKNDENVQYTEKLTIDIFKNFFKMNIKSSFKKKDIIVCGIHFRILYEAQNINNKNYKNKGFVDYLINYENYNNLNKMNLNNSKYESYIVEPYILLYDLVEPLKLQYSLFKEKNNLNEDKNTEANFYYLTSNYLSFFISWCKMINNNNMNLNNYSNLKQNMKQYGINSNLKYFSLYIINNQEIIDLIKISLLVKGIKFILNIKDCKKIIEKIKNKNHTTNNNYYNNSLNNNSYKNARITRILYAIHSILYPSEMINVNKNYFEYFYQNLLFYVNIIFIKYKLIDNYLSLGIFNNNNKENIFHKFKEYESPKNFLKEIIKTSRKKPFIFIKELENKLNFIVNPFILFKSSLSIESLYKKLDLKHIHLNLNKITYSYIKSDEISGIILAKLIYNYESFENKINNKNLANKSIKFVEQYDFDGNINYDSLNIINSNNGNYIDNESHNSTYDSRKNNIIDFDNMSFMTSKINISDNIGLSSKYNQESKININVNKNNGISPIINYLLNDFIIQLPPNCYKMNYNYENLEESSLLINKLKNKKYQINSYLKAFYYISDKKVINDWIEYNEKIFDNIHSCNGNIQHTLLKSYIYQLIFIFFIEKSFEQSKNILENIKLIYQNGVGFLISLDDLAIINIFEGLINEKNNDLTEAEKESFYSKSLMLLLLNYGEPRGRNNDSHKILLFPIWKIINQIYEIEQNSIMIDYFKEMFLSLDYFERIKYQKEKENYEIKNNENIINNFQNSLNNKNIIESTNNLLIDSLNFDSNNHNKNEIRDKNSNLSEIEKLFLMNEKTDKYNSEYFLSHSIFNNSIINKINSKYYSYSLIDVFDSIDLNNINNIEDKFFSNEFILYFLKVIQNLLASDNEILFGEKYIREIISNDILVPVYNPGNIDYKNTDIKNKKKNIPYQIHKSKSQKGLIIGKTEQKENKNLHFRNNSEKCIKKDNPFITNIFSHFLYKELLQKLSYKSNAPSGVIISFGNNSHNETGLDKSENITSPHIIYKLKNEIIKHIYAGWEHNIVITNEGEIYSFGHNQFFQCGFPNLIKTQESIKDPKNISKLNNNIKALSASCGNEHSLILSKDHTVYSFGNSEDGVLGIDLSNKNNVNQFKFNKIDFGEYTNKIIEISSGTVHNLALTYDGKIFSWGSSQGGQLGLPLEILEKQPNFKDNYYISTPIKVPINNKNINKNENSEINIIRVSCGEAHSLVLTNEGKVYSWGFGSNGQLGLGFCEDSFEPGEGLKNSMRYIPEKIEEINNENIVDIKCGKTFSMFINNKGELFACGVNDLNQLGIQEMPSKEHLFNKSEEMCYDFVYPIKVDYFLNMKVEKISCGEGHCLAVIKDILSNTETIWSWGNNKFGQLGQGTFIKKCLPRPINGLFEYNSYKFDEVACGGFHSLCLIKHNEDINWIYEDYEKIICTLIDDIGII